MKVQPQRFLSTGATGVDELLGGGFFPGSAMLVAGPAGSGKSSLAIQFLAEGVHQGEPGVLAMFEETPIKYLEQAKGFGLDLQQMADDEKLKLIYLRPLDLSVDETLHEILVGIEEVKAKRVVIDSLTGLEIALAPSFEEDFRESLYRLIGRLTGSSISILMTVENNDSYTELKFSQDRAPTWLVASTRTQNPRSKPPEKLATQTTQNPTLSSFPRAGIAWLFLHRVSCGVRI